ncbi:hypothetical protein QJQ45_023359 [Haematococcus lacustris]|nr:hypothetical protein QJQ45_023359 [Haematococcus lacustris]
MAKKKRKGSDKKRKGSCPSRDLSPRRELRVVIKVPEGAVLRGCKKTRRKLREHLRLRAEIHSQLRVIASLFVLRIFLSCLVGYPTPGFASAPQPPAVQPPQPPDAPPLPPLPPRAPAQPAPAQPASMECDTDSDSESDCDSDPEPQSDSESESESEPEPVTQPPQRRCSARLAARAPAAPTGPPLPFDCEDPLMLRQLKDFCMFFANPNFKTCYNQLQRRHVRNRHPMLMPAFEDPSNQALVAKLQELGSIYLAERIVKLYAKAARAQLGWSGEEAQLFIRMACGYGINAHSSELKAATLDKGHVADLIEEANKHRRLLGMKKEGSLQDTLPLPCRMRHAVHVCRWLERWQQPHTPPVPGQPKRGKRRGVGPRTLTCPPPFTLTPMARVGVHFVRVDSRVLHGVCRQLGLTKETREDFTSEPALSHHWARWFNTNKLRNKEFHFERLVDTDGVSVCVHYTRPIPTPPAPPPAASSSSTSSRPSAAAAAAHAVGLPHIGRGIAEMREFVFDPDTQIGVGIDPGVTQAVSAASGVWDPATGQLKADQLRRWKLTKGEVKHASGLNNARRNTERWLAPIKPHLQHLAAASSAGTSLEANLKHITVTLATWDAVWEVYLDPKWARQRLRLYGAQDRALEQFFNKLEEQMAELSMKRHGHAKQLVVFFGAATIGTGGGWGADAVLRACRKVVCRPRGKDQDGGRVVLVDEHRTSRVSSAVNGKQPCEVELNTLSATRPAGWKPTAGQVEECLVRPAWSQERGQPVRGLVWCPVVAPRKPPQAPRSSQAATQPAASEPGPSTPPLAKRSKPAAEPTKGKGKGKAAKAKPAPQPGRWLDRDCNAALNMQRIGESRWRPLELCFWPDQGALPAKGKEYPGLGYKRLRDKPPKAQEQQQQPAVVCEAATSGRCSGYLCDCVRRCIVARTCSDASCFRRASTSAVSSASLVAIVGTRANGGAAALEMRRLVCGNRGKEARRRPKNATARRTAHRVMAKKKRKGSDKKRKVSRSAQGKQRQDRRDGWTTRRRQVIKVPEGAVLRGCKKTRRKLREHLRLRAEIHSQLRVIASLFVLRIFLSCLVGYPTPGFASAPQPPAVQPPQPPDAPPLPPLPPRAPAQPAPAQPASMECDTDSDSESDCDSDPEPQSDSESESESEPEPVTQPPQRRCSARLAARAPAAPTGPPLPFDCEDPLMLRQLKDFCMFFANPNFKTCYNQLQRRHVRNRHPMLMPAFEDPSNQALVAKLQELGSIYLAERIVKLYAKAARAQLGWSGEEAQLFIRMACGYGINAHSSELKAATLDKGHVADLIEEANKHRRLLGMKKEGSLQDTLPLPCRMRHAVHVCRWLERWQQPHTPPVPGQPKRGKRRGVGPRTLTCPPPFTLTPMARVGVHFVRVDSRVLHGVCRQLGLTKETREDFTSEPALSHHWARWFNTNKLRNKEFHFERLVDTDGVSVCVHYTRPIPTPPAPPPAASSSSTSSRPSAAAAAAHAVGLPHIGRGIAEMREFVFDPDTQIGVGIDPGVTQAVSAASGVWDPATGQLKADQLRRWKLTKGEVKHASGLNNARRNTERWLAPIKPHLQHLAAASSAGTSLEANLKHITVTLATWDAVWEVYLDPKWARQRLRLYGAQDRALEQFFNKLEEQMAELSMKRHGHAKQLVVFFGAATIGTGGGWGADAVLRACRKVVCRPRGKDQDGGRVVLVDEHRTSRVSSAVNGKQPCEVELNTLSATRPAGWKPTAGQVEECLVRPAWSQERGQPVRGLVWCPVVAPRKPPQAPRSSQAATQPAASEPGPSTPPLAKRSKPAAEPTKGKGKGKAAKAKPAPQPGRWLDRDCNAALNMQRIGESRWRPLELCFWPDQGALPAKGKEYPGLGYKRLRDKPPKAQEQQQQPAVAQ